MQRFKDKKPFLRLYCKRNKTQSEKQYFYKNKEIVKARKKQNLNTERTISFLMIL